MTIRGRLGRLKQRRPPRRPRVRFIVLDHPPDGRTHVLLDDGTELPPGADWRPFAVDGTYTDIGGVAIDVLVGRKKADGEPGGWQLPGASPS